MLGGWPAFHSFSELLNQPRPVPGKQSSMHKEFRGGIKVLAIIIVAMVVVIVHLNLVIVADVVLATSTSSSPLVPSVYSVTTLVVIWSITVTPKTVDSKDRDSTDPTDSTRPEAGWAR